jgi:hypothetical protein
MRWSVPTDANAIGVGNGVSRDPRGAIAVAVRCALRVSFQWSRLFEFGFSELIGSEQMAYDRRKSECMGSDKEK